MQKVLLASLDDVPTALIEQEAPFLTRLASGLRFWGAPNCSNARAKVQTGRYSIRDVNLVGGIFDHQTLGSLPKGPWLLANSLGDVARTQWGKWHLCQHDRLADRADSGYDLFGGSQANLTGQSYFDWTTVVNGFEERVTQYATDWVVAKARAAVLSEDEYVQVDLNAAHVPLHYAPGDSGLPGDEDAMRRSMLRYADAALERLDRIAAERGYARIYYVDNGGTGQDGGKGTLSAKALNTYLGFDGFVLPEAPAVVDATDLYATVIELVTGAPPTNGDGVSMLSSAREAAFADKFSAVLAPPGENWEEAATDGLFKVIRKPSTGQTTFLTWDDQPTTENLAYLLAALDAR